MSNDEADALMERLERWDAKDARRKFLHRMEKKYTSKSHAPKY